VSVAGCRRTSPCTGVLTQPVRGSPVAAVSRQQKLFMPKRQAIRDSLALIFAGINKLKEAFPHKAFTIDGRLVGDIGEVIAALEYEVTLYEVLRPGYDGETPDGRRVQIKATFKDSLTFKGTPDYYLGFKLDDDGEYDEVYNGPGCLIFERFQHRGGIGQVLLAFPIRELRLLSVRVPEGERIRRRQS